MSKYAQGIYTPLHPEKYVGTKSIYTTIIYRTNA